MFPGKSGITDHRLQVNLLQATCFPHSISFRNIFEDGNHLVFWQPRIEKDGSPVFGKGFFATEAIQQSRLVGTISGSNADIFFTPNPVFGTVFILATKVFQIIHDSFPEIKPLIASKLRRNDTRLSNFRNRVDTDRSQGIVSTLDKRGNICYHNTTLLLFPPSRILARYGGVHFGPESTSRAFWFVVSGGVQSFRG